jgi:hypothetical protein
MHVSLANVLLKLELFITQSLSECLSKFSIEHFDFRLAIHRVSTPQFPLQCTPFPGSTVRSPMRHTIGNTRTWIRVRITTNHSQPSSVTSTTRCRDERRTTFTTSSLQTSSGEKSCLPTQTQLRLSMEIWGRPNQKKSVFFTNVTVTNIM